jgi:hypothetical protein
MRASASEPLIPACRLLHGGRTARGDRRVRRRRCTVTAAEGTQRGWPGGRSAHRRSDRHDVPRHRRTARLYADRSTQWTRAPGLRPRRPSPSDPTHDDLTSAIAMANAADHLLVVGPLTEVTWSHLGSVSVVHVRRPQVVRTRKPEVVGRPSAPCAVHGKPHFRRSSNLLLWVGRSEHATAG